MSSSSPTISNRGGHRDPYDSTDCTKAMCETQLSPVMKFTKIMKETGEIEITAKENKFLWAFGSGNVLRHHEDRDTFILDLSSGSKEEIKAPNMRAWLAHGVMTFLAWAVLVPISVNASLFQGRFPKGPLWFNLHRNFNTASFALLFGTFSIAVTYTTKEGMSSHSNYRHGWMGLTKIILTSFQVLLGLCHPALTVGWEAGHRSLGTLLLLCGFRQMSSGVKLFSIKYSFSQSNEDKLMFLHWVWIGFITTTIVGVWHSKIRKRVSDEPKCAPALNDFDSNARIQKHKTFSSEDFYKDEEIPNDLTCTKI